MNNINKNIDLIQKSGLFDSDWYARRYPDVPLLNMDPIEHYLRIGARLKRDPSPRFNTEYYLSANQDVALSCINPLIHYIKYGRKERRPIYPPLLAPSDFNFTIDIVIPIYNALHDVKICLSTILKKNDGFNLNLILVNDASDEETRVWLEDFCASHGGQLITHEKNLGYTKAVNAGLRISNASHVITLNSDTIVTTGWLKGMIRCMASSPNIGIVGPLSNAASWQNVPELYDKDGFFAINTLPDGMSADDLATIISEVSSRKYPRTSFLNGFCFMIKREVIQSIGYMDEDNFPRGYGEENDFCIRAIDSGFELSIADDAYVYHSKSKSFGHEQRKNLSRAGSINLKQKHTPEKVKSLVAKIRNNSAMKEIRRDIATGIKAWGQKKELSLILSSRILFLLPVRGGGGGAHSVIQEVAGMRRLGLYVKVAVKKNRLDEFLSQYKDIEDAVDIFIGFDNENLVETASNFDIVIGTIYSSIRLVKKINEALPYVMPAYYIQDYEPLFFPEGTRDWHVARDSYDLIPNSILFAKTYWIIQKVLAEHGKEVHKVEPSIDHTVYKLVPRQESQKIRVTAMIRPQTPRRGAERTMRVLSKLAKHLDDRISIHLFGCADNDDKFRKLDKNFAFTNHGILLRQEVADLLSKSDIFLDLSDYQAFGRTALEGMACGCIPVITLHGGTDEYAIDEGNALIVDPFDESSCIDRISKLVISPDKLHRMRFQALATASKYSVHRAAISELSVLNKALSRFRSMHPKPKRMNLALVPSRKKGNEIAGSGYVRTVLPYNHPKILDSWVVDTCVTSLPRQRAADTAILQRDMAGMSLVDLRSWATHWREAGGSLIYDLDDDLLDLPALQARGYTGDTNEIESKIQWALQESDIVTVSTSPLAEQLKKLLPISEKIRVIPNYLDGKLWALDRKRDHTSGQFSRHPHKIKIGYIGTPSHYQDMGIVASAMKRIELEFSDHVEVEVIGAFEADKPMFGKRISLPKKRGYPYFVKWLLERVHWDIGIIPLRNDEFNRCKSNIKFLEYGALDMAIVCSEAEAYRTICQHGRNSLVVSNTPEAWYNSIRRLILDTGLRKCLASSARDLVKNYYTLEYGIDQHFDTLMSSLAKK